MKQSKAKDSRRHIRRPLMGDLSGRLLVTSAGRAVPCLAVDVSVAGLRVLANEELSPGTPMTLAFESHALPLVVVWCEPDGKSGGSFACGLMAIESSCDLENFFISIGWLDHDEGTGEWLSEVEFVERSEE